MRNNFLCTVMWMWVNERDRWQKKRETCLKRMTKHFVSWWCCCCVCVCATIIIGIVMERFVLCYRFVSILLSTDTERAKWQTNRVTIDSKHRRQFNLRWLLCFLYHFFISFSSLQLYFYFSKSFCISNKCNWYSNNSTKFQKKNQQLKQHTLHMHNVMIYLSISVIFSVHIFFARIYSDVIVVASWFWRKCIHSLRVRVINNTYIQSEINYCKQTHLKMSLLDPFILVAKWGCI